MVYILTFVSSYSAGLQSMSEHTPPPPAQALFLSSLASPHSPWGRDQADHEVREQTTGAAWSQENIV